MTKAKFLDLNKVITLQLKYRKDKRRNVLQGG